MNEEILIKEIANIENTDEINVEIYMVDNWIDLAKEVVVRDEFFEELPDNEVLNYLDYNKIANELKEDGRYINYKGKCFYFVNE